MSHTREAPVATAPDAVRERPASPYPGLEAYTEKDAAFFFGRDSEAQIIAANLLSVRLTLLFGPSGVGKSSVLRASVVASLRKRAAARLDDDDSPGICVVLVSKWRNDPLVAVASACRAAVLDLLGRHHLPDPEPGATLTEVLEHWGGQAGGRLLVIFDQFEEYFLYHEDERGANTFDDQFPNAIASTQLRANFLLSLRDDALARLERFKGRIPRLFENRLQIDRLTVRAAREATVEPINEYNRRAPDEEPYAIEDELVEDVLADVYVQAHGRTGAATLAPTAIETADGAVDGDSRVEAPILQVVLTAIWACESEHGSRALRASTLRELGGVQAIVRDRLERRMQPLGAAEQDVAAAIFQFLVTPSEAKIAWSAAELAQFTEIPQERITSVLETLSAGDARILRPVPSPGSESAPRYEIFHDVLALPIREWRISHEARREGRELARRRLLGVVRVLGSVAAVAIVAIAIVAWGQRNDAQRQRNEARKQAQVAQGARHKAEIATAKAKEETRKADRAKGQLAHANAKLLAANREKASIVDGLQLVRNVKDTVESRTGYRLRVLDFQFSPDNRRPVAYQIQFDPKGLNSPFFLQAKIWVWPLDQTGKSSGYRRFDRQFVTYRWQLTSGATRIRGSYWKPAGAGCVGARGYDVRRGGAVSAHVNFLWRAGVCGEAPPHDWSQVDAALKHIAGA
ncbi:MAG: hypothetical protein M3Q31_02890 [Actinomycetota bacterium]|nr:hypothetical protein [Actinomycetota bacterium]